MSQSEASLQRVMASAQGLKSVVRTMKALAAASIGPYDTALQSLEGYVKTVDSGLSVFFRRGERAWREAVMARNPGGVGAIVIGTDQGMVGAFNDQLAHLVGSELGSLPGEVTIWAVGERVHGRIMVPRGRLLGPFPVPDSVESIPAFMSQLLASIEQGRTQRNITQLRLFYNRPAGGPGFEPVVENLLPLDAAWVRDLQQRPWPPPMVPELAGEQGVLLVALIREYLFVSLYKACARSGAAEQGTRLLAMQRAERNINDLLEDLQRAYHQQRQTAIMEELFDVLAGVEALSGTGS